ncbi:MAG TPA: septum formation initiator family protein [Symbiobacteriaceae bacterium]|nr:septum formation initiator family protein [Symbiobacteriaceae bacterium]
MRGRKRGWRRNWLTWISLLCVCGLLGWVGLSLARVESRLSEVRAQRVALEQQVTQKQRQFERLQEDAKVQRTDEYMELMAKSLGYTYPGEQLYQSGTRKN